MGNLTTEAIKRLVSAPVEVKLWNGCYNTASVKATFARYSYELTVQVTHPLLAWQCGDKNEASLFFWQSCNGRQIEIPAELRHNDSEAQAISDSNKSMYRDSCLAMGFAT